MGLVLKGGQVLDPGAGLTGALDVRIRDGLVAEVGAGLAADGDVVEDVGGRLVLPGLIDLHAHCFIGAADLGPRTDDVARSTGVTTWVDGGSAGAAPTACSGA
jgi:dihydroorotase